MKLLITGGSGFIGRNLAEILGARHEVFAPGRAELNLLDESAVCRYLRTHSFDVVVHAATVRANRKIGAPAGLLHDNLRMFFNLERQHEAFGRMLFLSSGAVYDRRHAEPSIAENHFGRHVPADEYGFSKYICGRTVEDSINLFDLRLFGVFGPHEDWEIRFLSNACCRAVWDRPIGIRQNVLFDYLDVADLARIVEWFFTGEPRFSSYNVSRGQAVDLATLAASVVRASGKDLPIVVRDPGMGAEYSGSNQRLMNELRDFQFREIDDSIRSLYQWYEERKDQIDPRRLDFDA